MKNLQLAARGCIFELAPRNEPGSQESRLIPMYSHAYMAGPFLRAQNPRKLFNKKSVKIRGAEGKWISGDTLGCPDLGSGRPERGKSEKSGGIFPSVSV